MGGNHYFAALLQAVVDGAHGGAYACVGGNFAIFHGHIEVGADEHALAFQIKIGDSNDRHWELQVLRHKEVWDSL